MTTVQTTYLSTTAPNQFVETGGRKLAYRSIGSGKPIVLCARFRGNMDVWDPAFLDALADNGFRVFTFDYTGIGLSTGEKSFDAASMAKDASDLMDALDLKNVVISGHSLGGIVAQIVVAMYSQRVSHAVLIGAIPPGPNVKPAEQLFFDTAVIPNYTLEHETILFFEPRSPASREAARKSVERIALRTQDRSIPVPVEWAAANLGTEPPKGPLFDSDAVLEALKATSIPILHLGGDHDLVFPVENWYALNQVLPTLSLITFPRSGHGPHHEHTTACAEYISSFVRST